MFPQSIGNAALLSISFSNIVSTSSILNESKSSLVPFLLCLFNSFLKNNPKEFQGISFILYRFSIWSKNNFQSWTYLENKYFRISPSWQHYTPFPILSIFFKTLPKIKANNLFGQSCTFHYTNSGNKILRTVKKF